MRALVLTALAGFMLAGAGCRGEKLWSCNNPQRHACSERSAAGGDPATTKRQQESCREMGSTVVEGPCPTANVIGTCGADSASSGERMVYYAPRDTADAQRSCTGMGGRWQPK